MLPKDLWQIKGMPCGGMAKIFQENIRKIDILARYGGEEFVIILPEADLPAACCAAERPRKTVDEGLIVVDENPISMTVSIGIATINLDKPDFPSLVSKVDSALYHAKRGGRNRTEAIE